MEVFIIIKGNSENLTFRAVSSQMEEGADLTIKGNPLKVCEGILAHVRAKFLHQTIKRGDFFLHPECEYPYWELPEGRYFPGLFTGEIRYDMSQFNPITWDLWYDHKGKFIDVFRHTSGFAGKFDLTETTTWDQLLEGDYGTAPDTGMILASFLGLSYE